MDKDKVEVEVKVEEKAEEKAEVEFQEAVRATDWHNCYCNFFIRTTGPLHDEVCSYCGG